MLRFASSTFLRIAPMFAASALVLGSVGCGGGGAAGAVPGEDEDPTLDGGTDSGPKPDSGPRPDVGPGGCGFGACTPGTGCFDGCNSCYCDEGGWSCTTMACEDAGPGPDVIEPAPPCPSVPPKDRQACTSEGQLCGYANDCGGKTNAECVVGPAGNTVWRVERVCAGVCPTTLPKPGTTCPAPTKCGYPNACGSVDSAWCDFAGGKWNVLRGDCPPPPPPTCPTKRPAEGSACPAGLGECLFNNGCGGVDYGFCSGGKWAIKDSPCTPGCPASKPTSGAACKSPSGASCAYVVASSCTTSCFCAEDYRWACIPAPCTSPPFPGG